MLNHKEPLYEAVNNIKQYVLLFYDGRPPDDAMNELSDNSFVKVLLKRILSREDERYTVNELLNVCKNSAKKLFS